MVLSNNHWYGLIHLLTNKRWLILLQLNQVLPAMQDQITPSTDKDGSSDQCDGIQKLSLAHDLLSLASSSRRKIASTIPIESHPSMKAKRNLIYANNDGSEIEQECIEEYQEWLTIRVNDCWESNCELMYILSELPKMSINHTIEWKK